MNIKDKRNIVRDKYWTPMYLPRDARFQEGGEFIVDATKSQLQNRRKVTKGVMDVQKKQIRSIENQIKELKRLYEKGEITKGEYDWAVATYNNDIYALREIIAEEQHEDIERLNDIIQTRRDKYRERTGEEEEDISEYMAKQHQRYTKNKCDTSLTIKTKRQQKPKISKNVQQKTKISRSNIKKIIPITPQKFDRRVNKSINSSMRAIAKLNKMSKKIK